MHRSRIVILSACLFGIAAAFLPWESQSLLNEVSYLKGIDTDYGITQTNIGDGWLTITCFLIMMMIAITGKLKAAPNRKKLRWIALFALASMSIAIYDMIIIFSKSKVDTGDMLVMKLAPGAGLYVSIVEGVALVIMSLTYRSAANSTAIPVAK